jgi:DNA-binding CsgD family transcriptional regulator
MLAAVAICCFILLLGLEVLTETDDIALSDILVDALGILLNIGAAVGVALLAFRLQAQHDEKIALIHSLDVARAQGDEWRRRASTHLAGLRAELDAQLEAWGLTFAERDIAMLLLKGLSHKEVASLRKTSEATVRQQAQAIYRKANLPGKAAFCAYFLEDLLVPGVAAEASISPAAVPAVAKPRPGEDVVTEAERHPH